MKRVLTKLHYYHFNSIRSKTKFEHIEEEVNESRKETINDERSNDSRFSCRTLGAGTEAPVWTIASRSLNFELKLKVIQARKEGRSQIPERGTISAKGQQRFG